MSKPNYLISDLSLYLYHFLKSSKRLYTQDIISTRNIIICKSILAYEQYGFRCNSSPEKASYKLGDNVLSALNNKLLLGGIFCDLEKAFNCLNHDILLSKLEFCGITSKANAVLKPYLNDRHQRGRIDNRYSNTTFSGWGLVKQGIPQG